MIIDGHAHACGDLLTEEGIIRVLDAEGVDKVVLVPGEHESAKTYRIPNLARLLPHSEVGSVTNAMTRLAVRLSAGRRHLEEGNQRVFQFARAQPDRILQFYWVLLQGGFNGQRVRDRFATWRPRGLKVHQCWDHFEIDGPAFSQLAGFAAVNQLPVFIHLGSGRQAASLAGFARAHPETTFIVGHLYGLAKFAAAGPAPRNVYFDCSCPDIVSDARLRDALCYAGPERIIMGSDTPYGYRGLSRSIMRIRSLSLRRDDEELLLSGNMARLLGLASHSAGPHAPVVESSA